MQPTTQAFYPASELIINADGSIYHLGLKPEHLGDYILTVGDPDRVTMVSQYLDSISFTSNRREFVAHVGRLGRHQVTVLSTGMGTDNIEIVMNELDVLANVDLRNRVPLNTQRRLNIIRLGTSGALQHDIELGSVLVSAGAIGLDTLMQFYDLPQSADEEGLVAALQDHLQLGFRPYFAAASNDLLNLLPNAQKGLTLTCPGFYAPQGRQLRAAVKNLGIIQQYQNFNWSGKRITNFEMETAGYYSMGQLLGHEVLSVNAIVAHRLSNKFTPDPLATVDNMIKEVMAKLAAS